MGEFYGYVNCVSMKIFEKKKCHHSCSKKALGLDLDFAAVKLGDFGQVASVSLLGTLNKIMKARLPTPSRQALLSLRY